MTRVFDYSRYLVLLAVIGLLLAAVAVFVFGAITTVFVIIEAFEHGEFNALGARVLSIEIIEMIDLFLLGTVLMITSIGLYQLFIKADMDLPEWLVVANLEQLKVNLLAVIVVMLAILFLGEVAGTLARDEGILNYGLAIAAVLAGLALIVWVFLRVVQQEEEHIHEVLLEAQEEKSDEHANNQ